MIYEDCRRILQAAVDAKMIQTVPETADYINPDGSKVHLTKGDLIIYREAGKAPEEWPEGWYAQPLWEAAQELAESEGGQKCLLHALRKRNIAVSLIDEEALTKMRSMIAG